MTSFALSKSFALLILFSISSGVAIGSEQTESACDPSAYKISKQITVTSKYSLSKKKNKICVEGNGGFHILPGGTLELKDKEITLLSNNNEALIKLEPGSSLRINRVKINSKYITKVKETKDSNSGALGITGSINIVSGTTSQRSGLRIEISDSKFVAENTYSTAGISITSTAENPKPVIGSITNSKFKNIWSPVLVLNAQKFEVTSNILKKNPGSNIVISGSEVLISRNDIVFPGAGYIGDGITVYESLKNSQITRNNITGGSCYGIWFFNSEFHNVLVANNRISLGVTTGINISNDKKIKSDNLLIKENHLAGNAGFGVGIDKYVSGVTLTSNYFIGNAASYGNNDISISNTASAVIEHNNISAQSIDPEWAKIRDPYRTHVNPSLKILNY
ncbi:right-handed parallel beta-helix repeat-containing protein [Pseudomonas moraviensis]|uniref:mannuronan 5-epimerase n=1 Tax=Pseudomonas moraviensis TaxID=321662 RepID=A0A7Y9VR20_9PSED|nr:right-handed parallel beta-helix repeat-containing protein [Pseudomonas moraviensis]NYH06970.1 hypothetical protein [Pseudomonas moraviensis]